MNHTAPLLRTHDALGEDELGSLRRTFGFAGDYDDVRAPTGGDGVQVEDVSQGEIDFCCVRFQNEDSNLSREEVPPEESCTPGNSGHDREDRVPYTTPGGLARDPRRETMIMENARRQSSQFPGVCSRAPPTTQERRWAPFEQPVSPHVNVVSPTASHNFQTGSESPSQAYVNGMKLPIRSRPTPNLSEHKLWDKTKRSTLDHEALQAFVKSTTSYALSKTNKLSATSLRPDDDGKLAEIHNLRSQLSILKRHLYTHDMLETFTVVVPRDVANSPK